MGGLHEHKMVGVASGVAFVQIQHASTEWGSQDFMIYGGRDRLGTPEAECSARLPRADHRQQPLPATLAPAQSTLTSSSTWGSRRADWHKLGLDPC